MSLSKEPQLESSTEIEGLKRIGKIIASDDKSVVAIPNFPARPEGMVHSPDLMQTLSDLCLEKFGELSTIEEIRFKKAIIGNSQIKISRINDIDPKLCAAYGSLKTTADEQLFFGVFKQGEVFPVDPIIEPELPIFTHITDFESWIGEDNNKNIITHVNLLEDPSVSVCVTSESIICTFHIMRQEFGIAPNYDGMMYLTKLTGLKVDNIDIEKNYYIRLQMEGLQEIDGKGYMQFSYELSSMEIWDEDPEDMVKECDGDLWIVIT